MQPRLLALAGCRAGELGALSLAEWRALDALAEAHRLGPYFHGRLSRGEMPVEVPQDIVEGWREAHRANAIAVLAQRRALAQAATLLGGLGIEAVALKGSALAWSVWPSPAERVMRDIDLLVPQYRAVKAYKALRDAGWQGPAATPELLDRLAQEETHLPLLVSPDGVLCELHAHAWASAPLAGLAMPSCDDAGLLERSVFDEVLDMRVPAAQDMLAHLVVHCACSHLFNVGPLALADIDYLTRKRAIDWPRFWEAAQREGYERAAALVLALTDRWLQPGLVDASGCPVEAPTEEIERAETLLVQQPADRKDINAIAGLTLGGRSDRMPQHPLDEAEGSAGGLARAAQLARRGLSVAGSMLDGPTRRDGLATAATARWLQGD
ncbi:nucleotidyltransferase family protein [Qipengyuania gaetbuli]|uniref:nucleotidyltransferase family protein n=1 Tax=Qipengyuania gaetbuli TaxID=266952 RepID=UPI001C993972|nr:nucleotidyltransferase family protein [Qipengyuania gaetbuli]MBY6015970.1 nucleotidyltransferase family protein [Qipengyuania gaetbuli]